MAFLVKYQDPEEGPIVVSLHPRPSEISYPERRLIKTKVTKDGAVIINRPMQDSRPRRWIWARYPANGTAFMEFNNQWTFLKTLETKALWQAGSADPSIFVWENESGIGGFGETLDNSEPDLIDYLNIQWTKVTVIQASQELAKGTGRTIYDTSIFEFIITDPDYNDF